MKKLLGLAMLLALSFNSNAQDKVPSFDNTIYHKYDNGVYQIFCPVYTKELAVPTERMALIHRNKKIFVSRGRAKINYKFGHKKYSKNIYWMPKNAPMTVEELNNVIVKANENNKISDLKSYFDVINKAMEEARKVKEEKAK
jgi:hypothetical protein